MNENRLLHMGTVGRAHGVRGELTMLWHGDYIPVAGDVLFLKKADGLAPYTVLGSRMQKRLVLALEHVASRDAAEALTGAEVFMDRDSLPPPEADACYLADLIGSEVYLEDGTLVGQLDHYEFPAGQAVWAIRNGRREILFPAMPCFIKALDPQQKKAVISPPPGLLGVYGA